MRATGAEFDVVWQYVSSQGMEASKRYLDMDNPPKLEDEDFPSGFSTNFYRSDDVSATAYFYLDKPASNLPTIQSVDERTAEMSGKVYKYQK